MPPTTLFGLGYGTGPAGYGYPPGARRPSISYPDSPFTWYDHVEITASLPTNGGGPITNYSVLSGSLPAGVSLNATTGELTGTPTTQQSAASVVIRARGPGGVSDTTISVEVLAMPLSLGSSLAAWYKADAGCYTDAACLFASASSQYLSKTSPTFAPTTKMTIAFDYKPTTTAATQTLINRFTNAGENQFLVGMRSAKIQIYVCSSGADTGSNDALGSTSLADGVNSRVVIVYDGTLSAANRITMYVDGVQQTLTITGTIPSSLSASTLPLVVGGDTFGQYSDGALARLGFSSLALSGAALTAAHTSTFWADMTAARQADWFSFYNLCEASSTRVDSTGLNNLTPTNGPTVAAGPGEGAAVNNSPVKRIEDQSGNGIHATQSDITKQRLWIASGQNGRATLRDVTGAYYTMSLTGASGSWTLFSARKAGTTGATRYFIDSETGRLIFYTRGDSGTDIGIYDGGFDNIADPGTAFSAFVWVLTSGGNVEVFKNGTSLGTSAYTAQAIGGAVALFARYDGAAAADDGEFGEAFITPTAQPPVAATAYLRSRWGI